MDKIYIARKSVFPELEYESYHKTKKGAEMKIAFWKEEDIKEIKEYQKYKGEQENLTEDKIQQRIDEDIDKFNNTYTFLVIKVDLEE